MSLPSHASEDPWTDAPLEQLEVEITTLASQLAAGTCRWLAAIAAYERRGGWEAWGCTSMVHWLTWRCALSPTTARQHLRVAHALEKLPLVKAEFGAGRLSFSQVRALCRVATPATEAQVIELAKEMTGGQLDKLVATYRGVRRITTKTAKARAARRGLYHYLDEDGTRVIIIRQPPEDSETILRAVEQEVAATWKARHEAADTDVGASPSYPDDQDTMAARKADALLSLVVRGTAASPSSDATREEAEPEPLVVVHVDAETLAASEDGGDGDDEGDGSDSDGMCRTKGGVALAVETARRLGCDASAVALIHHPDSSVDAGRRTRIVPRPMRRALKMRDRHCVFPGCTTTAGTHAHHVVHWSQGGVTSLDNLALLCPFHHRRLHEGGYGMRAAPPGEKDRWVFTRPDGVIIPLHPQLEASDPARLPAA